MIMSTLSVVPVAFRAARTAFWSTSSGKYSVIWRPFTAIGGEAYLSENGYVIALSELMRVEAFERIFFHEVAHIELGDCETLGEPASYDTLHTTDQLEALLLVYPSAEDILANVRVKEARADLRGRELQDAFEADLGISLIDLFI